MELRPPGPGDFTEVCVEPLTMKPAIGDVPLASVMVSRAELVSQAVLSTHVVVLVKVPFDTVKEIIKVALALLDAPKAMAAVQTANAR